jgi:hypothetical protein
MPETVVDTTPCAYPLLHYVGAKAHPAISFQSTQLGGLNSRTHIALQQGTILQDVPNSVEGNLAIGASILSIF